MKGKQLRSPHTYGDCLLRITIYVIMTDDYYYLLQVVASAEEVFIIKIRKFQAALIPSTIRWLRVQSKLLSTCWVGN